MVANMTWKFSVPGEDNFSRVRLRSLKWKAAGLLAVESCSCCALSCCTYQLSKRRWLVSCYASEVRALCPCFQASIADLISNRAPRK